MQELAPERRAVQEAIQSLRLTPVMFELGARPHPPRALYRAYLEQSDVFVGLYWESYGWVPPGEELSGLEDEYRLSGDRPKLIYVKTPASGRQPRLDELIAQIQRDDSASYRPFGSADDLRTLVADDLAVLLTERFAASTTTAEPAPIACRPASTTGDAAHRPGPGPRAGAGPVPGSERADGHDRRPWRDRQVTAGVGGGRWGEGAVPGRHRLHRSGTAH